MLCLHWFQNLREHRRKKPYCQDTKLNCKFCDKTFNRPSALTTHLTSHQKLNCQFCDKLFERKGTASAKTRLESHLKSCSKPKKPNLNFKYKCDACNNAYFTNKEELQKHKTRCQITLPKCHLCSKAFDSKFFLSRHNTECFIGPRFYYSGTKNGLWRSGNSQLLWTNNLFWQE